MNSIPFGHRPIDGMAEARRCCDIYADYKADRDRRTKSKLGDPYFLNLAVVNAKRDMDNACNMNRAKLRVIIINGEFVG